MNSPHEVIIRPIVTERSFDQMSLNKYSFEVARSAPKEEIASAVEALFNVHVKKVNTQWVKPKTKDSSYIGFMRENKRNYTVFPFQDRKAPILPFFSRSISLRRNRKATPHLYRSRTSNRPGQSQCPRNPFCQF